MKLKTSSVTGTKYLALGVFAYITGKQARNTD